MQLLVRLEQITDGRVESTGGPIWRHGEVKNPIGDGAVHPAAHTSVGLIPGGNSQTGRDGAVDVT